MAAAPANVAQDLNNAIYSLATLNPRNPLAGNLNNAWQAWFSTGRNWLPDSSWWLALKGFWATYAAARATAANLSERTPPADAIEPTLWKSLLSDVQRKEVLLGDAARATREAGHELEAAAIDSLARGIKNTVEPVLWVAGAIAVALVISSFGKRRRR